MARTSENDINLRQAVNDAIKASNAGEVSSFSEQATQIWDTYFSNNEAESQDEDILSMLSQLLSNHKIPLGNVVRKELLSIQYPDRTALMGKINEIKALRNSVNSRTDEQESRAADIIKYFAPKIITMLEKTSTEQFSSIPEVAEKLTVAISKLDGPTFIQVPGLVFEILERDPDSPYAYVVWGLSLMECGKTNDALSAFDMALMLSPSCLPALCGKILLMVLYSDGPGVDCEFQFMKKAISVLPAKQTTDFIPLLDIVSPPDDHEIRYLSIGGGPAFNHRHWHNLEAVVSKFNPTSFEFTPGCTFPFDDSSIELVYSSHCIEHLDDATVERIIVESSRVLSPDGALILKIPDFDRCLLEWQTGNPNFMFSTTWGLPKILPLWQRRGVEDTIHSRSTMMFCGFWNDAYGGEHGHFAGSMAFGEEAYHGPAVLDDASLEKIIATKTPHGVAKALRQHVVDTEPSYHFNHQNAWSREELGTLLGTCGYRVLSFDIEKIIQRYHWVPEIKRYDRYSTYCLAVPLKHHEHE